MKKCNQCGAELNDNVMFCTKCGAKMGGTVNQQTTGGYTGQPVNDYTYRTQYNAVVDPYDHTAEFDPRDISDNKVIAMLVYLMGAVGIIIALLASSSSKYIAFHVRQALKFLVVGILTSLASIILCWTIIVPVAAGIFATVLWVCKIIAFFSICKGKACEPPIIRGLNFLK